MRGPRVVRVLRAAALLGAAASSLSCSLDSTEPFPIPLYQVLFECTQTVQEVCILRSDSTVARIAPGVVAMDPAASPDGTKIAFVGGDLATGETDVYVMNRDGSGITRLTTAAGTDDQPAWSPDGEQIAFRSFRTQLDGDIWVMDANGANQINLTPDPTPGVIDNSFPAWAPDGSRIAYSSNEGGSRDIWTMSATGTDRFRVTNTAQADAEPMYSPDGTWIAYRRIVSANDSDIAIVRMDGGTITFSVVQGIQKTPAIFPHRASSLSVAEVLFLMLFVHQNTSTSRSDVQFNTEQGRRTLVGSVVPNGSLNPSYIRIP